MRIEQVKMENINIDDKQFFYEIFVEVDEYGESWETVFYSELRTKKRKKYLLFGPMVEVPDHKEAFTVPFNIASPHLTKDELRSILERHVELLSRQEQILKGELV